MSLPDCIAKSMLHDIYSSCCVVQVRTAGRAQLSGPRWRVPAAGFRGCAAAGTAAPAAATAPASRHPAVGLSNPHALSGHPALIWPPASQRSIASNSSWRLSTFTKRTDFTIGATSGWQHRSKQRRGGTSMMTAASMVACCTSCRPMGWRRCRLRSGS